MLIIVYNCHCDWLPTIIYLQIFPGIRACMRASKQADQLSKSERIWLTDKAAILRSKRCNSQIPADQHNTS